MLGVQTFVVTVKQFPSGNCVECSRFFSSNHPINNLNESSAESNKLQFLRHLVICQRQKNMA